MNIRTTRASAFAAALLLLAPAALAQSQRISRVSVRPDGRQIGPPVLLPENSAGVDSISDDGRFVIVFEYLNPSPPNYLSIDTRLLDRLDGSQVPIILGAGGAPLDSDISRALLSPDGLRVTFNCDASNVPGGLSTGYGNVYMLHRPTGQLVRVNQGIGGVPNGNCYLSGASPDGRFVVFSSASTNLVVNDNNFAVDVFVCDLQTGVTQRVSVSSAGQESSLESDPGYITPSGRYVLFDNYGDDLVPADSNGNSADVYLRDRTLGTTELISVTPIGVAGNSSSNGLWISSDGRYVGFRSNADNLVAGDTNGFNDIFIRDRQTATTTICTLTSSGAQINNYAGGAMFSADGRYVSFDSEASNVVAGDTNLQTDLFVRDLQTNTTARINLTPLGGQVSFYQGSSPYAYAAAISSNGRFLAIGSNYSELVEGDSNDAMDGYIVDRASNVAAVTTYCTAKTTSPGCVPVITSAGEPRSSGFDSFYVSAAQVRSNTRGAFIWSLASSSTPFGGGTLCVATPYQLAGVASESYGGTSGPCNQGQFVLKVSQSFMAAHGLAPGTTVFAQFLSRDSGFSPPNNVGLTDAIRFTIAP